MATVCNPSECASWIAGYCTSCNAYLCGTHARIVGANILCRACIARVARDAARELDSESESTTMVGASERERETMPSESLCGASGCALCGRYMIAPARCITCGRMTCYECTRHRMGAYFYTDNVARGYCLECASASEGGYSQGVSEQPSEREQEQEQARESEQPMTAEVRDCPACGSHIDSEDDERLCEICREYVHSVCHAGDCTGCGREYCIACSQTTPEGERICSTCTPRVCDDCGSEFVQPHGDGNYEHRCDACGKWLCDECRLVADSGTISCDRHYHTCANCGYSWCGDEEDDSYCESCREDMASEHIHDYSYKPRAILHGTPLNGTYIGAEWEVNVVGGNPSEGADFLWEHSDDEDRYYLKYDSSVVGYEIVTHPGDHRAWLDGEVIDWDTWARYCRDYAVRLRDGDNNGTHLHISRDAFYRNGTRRNGGTLDVGHLWRFTMLIYRNDREWRDIGGRWDSHYGSWHRLGEMMGRAERYASGDDMPDRYSCINYENERTIELRFLKPHTDKAIALGQIEMVFAAAEYTKAIDMADVETGALSWHAFTCWLTDHAHEYEFAIKMIGG